MRGWFGARAAQTRGSLCGAGRRRPVLAPAVAASQSLGADSSAPTRVGGRPGPQCGPLRSPLCAAQTSVSGMPGGEEERPCPAGWLLCRGRHANAAPSASTGLLPPAPPRRPAHLGLRATAGGGALRVGFASSPCAPRQNARNLVEGLRLICPCAQCVVMSVQQSRCLINNY